jgi:hypothetical protein
VTYLNGSKSLTSGAAITFDGTNFATTGTATATKLIPTGTSVTGNGLYLPAANALGLSTNGTNAVYIDSSQNVGIGTSSPTDKLHVVTSAVNGGVTVSGSVDPQYYLSSSGGNTGRFKISDANSIVMMGSWTNIATGFFTNGAERARISSAGDLLVGCTSQANSARATWQTATNNTRYIGFQTTAGAEIGYIFNNTTATQYSTTSDYRLKKDVVPMTGALAKVAALKPVTYKWKFDNSDGEGFIAHELQEVCPSAVVGQKDEINADGNPVYQGIDTSFLVATLTAAIQEQQTLITALTARITALENK